MNRAWLLAFVLLLGMECSRAAAPTIASSHTLGADTKVRSSSVCAVVNGFAADDND